MFYIRHDSDNFSIIDCCLSDDNRERIVDELIDESVSNDITRFISTHPDEDHIQGIEYLDDRMPIANFYCVENIASKDDETDSFRHYCSLRDSDKAFYVSKGCTRRWMNRSSNERGQAGIQILWPNLRNPAFKVALRDAAAGITFNNISLVATYKAGNDAKMMWLGDLETDFMESIEYDIELSPVHIVFAPRHGRTSTPRRNWRLGWRGGGGLSGICHSSRRKRTLDLDGRRRESGGDANCDPPDLEGRMSWRLTRLDRCNYRLSTNANSLTWFGRTQRHRNWLSEPGSCCWRRLASASRRRLSNWEFGARQRVTGGGGGKTRMPPPAWRLV